MCLCVCVRVCACVCVCERERERERESDRKGERGLWAVRIGYDMHVCACVCVCVCRLPGSLLGSKMFSMDKGPGDEVAVPSSQSSCCVGLC